MEQKQTTLVGNKVTRQCFKLQSLYLTSGQKTQHPSAIRRFVLGRGSGNKIFFSNKFSFVSPLVEKRRKKSSEWMSYCTSQICSPCSTCKSLWYCWIFAAIKAEWLTWSIGKYLPYEKLVFKMLKNVFAKCCWVDMLSKVACNHMLWSCAKYKTYQ